MGDALDPRLAGAVLVMSPVTFARGVPLVALSTLVAALVACSIKSEGTALGPPDGSATADGASVTEADGAALADAGASDDAQTTDGAASDSAPSTPTKSGFVELGLSFDTPPKSYAFAGFSDGTKAPSCRETLRVGSCWVYDCTAHADAGVPVDAGPPKPPPSAGALTITSTVLTSPLTLTYSENSGYSSPNGGATYASGDMFTVAAAGADIPAFTLSGVAPEPVALVAPACASKACGDLDRTKDLPLAWSGGGGGGLSLNIQSADPTSAIKGAIGVACSIDGNTSKMTTVPKELLAKLFPDPEAGFTIFSRSQVKGDAGGWSVAFNIDNLGPLPFTFNVK